MIKKIVAIVCCICCMFSVAACNPAEEGVNLNKVSGTVETWSMADSIERSEKYRVEVSADGKTWQDLDVYVAEAGHQLGDSFLYKMQTTFDGTPYKASMVVFDFTGTIALRVTYKNGTLNDNYVIAPASYNVASERDTNTVTFTLTQSETAPRKVVFRPENEWEAEVLHILTNTPEDEYKQDPTAANVYVIEEGDEIPLRLPEGKTVYYFKKGTHNLPDGYWVELDLGSVKELSRYEIITPTADEGMTGGLCFEIMAKEKAEDTYTSVVKVSGKAAENKYSPKGDFSSLKARYVRLFLQGNYNELKVREAYPLMSYVKEFKLFDKSGENVALNKAVDGSEATYTMVTDGSEGGMFGNYRAGETFGVCSGYTYYLEKGAVVKGALIGKNKENVTISGRGMLDCRDLLSTVEYYESRNSAINFEQTKNVTVEGISILNAPMWSVVINYSENVLVSGINLFGSCTNSDGIHFSATKHARATGCFIRTTDDLFVAYHYGNANDLTFENSVLWSDGARILLLGLADTGNIVNVTMQNCDVINYHNVVDLNEHGGFVQIVATGGKTISDVTIKDVRIDAVRCPSVAPFINIRAGNNLYGAGHIQNVTVENVSYAAEPVATAKSLVAVMQTGGSVKNVKFKNVSLGGVTLDATNYSNYIRTSVGMEIAFS